jgi:hypothetical protein
MSGAYLIEHAKDCAATFVLRASEAREPREAADWALAAKNMAGAVHSLVGADCTERRDTERRDVRSRAAA